jgi:hypothetical protein
VFVGLPGNKALWVWGLVVLVGLSVLLGLAGYSISWGLDGWRAHRAGIPGTFVVAECHDAGGKSPTTDCTGTYVSDDGTLRIPTVLSGDERSTGDHVPVTIASADSRDVWLSDDPLWWLEPAVAIALPVGLLAFFAWQAVEFFWPWPRHRHPSAKLGRFRRPRATRPGTVRPRRRRPVGRS